MADAATRVRPSFAECRQAAGSVRRADRWREVRAAVRPRGSSGPFRARAPLPLILLRAGSEDRLLWWSADDFAVLAAPADDPPVGSPAWLRWLDTWWEVVLFTVPMLVLLAGAVGAALLWPTRPLIAIGLAGAVTVYAAVLMAAGAVRGFRWVHRVLIKGNGRELTELGFGQLSAGHWSVVVCHTPPTRMDGLVTAVRQRAGAGAVFVAEGGVTASGTLEALRSHPLARPLGPDVPVLVLGGAEADLPEPRSGVDRSAAGIPLLLVAMMVIIAVTADGVATWERAACRGAECAERPASYWDAVYWLLNRLSGGDPEGLGAATFQGRSLGLLVTLMGLFVLGWVVASLWQQSVGRARNVGVDLARSYNDARPVVDGPAAPAPVVVGASTPGAGRRRLAPFAVGVIVGVAGVLLARRRRGR